MFFILHLVFTYFKDCSLPSTQFIFLTSTEVYKVQEDDLKKKKKILKNCITLLEESADNHRSTFSTRVLFLSHFHSNQH